MNFFNSAFRIKSFQLVIISLTFLCSCKEPDKVYHTTIQGHVYSLGTETFPSNTTVKIYLQEPIHSTLPPILVDSTYTELDGSYSFNWTEGSPDRILEIAIAEDNTTPINHYDQTTREAVKIGDSRVINLYYTPKAWVNVILTSSLPLGDASRPFAGVLGRDVNCTEWLKDTDTLLLCAAGNSENTVITLHQSQVINADTLWIDAMDTLYYPIHL